MLNDISFKKFAIISLSLFLAFNGSIALDYLNLGIPLVRQVFGFIFLTFMPGYTILRILRVHRINKTEAFLYAVGLSLAYMMVIGVLSNFICPVIGIKNPISSKSLLVAFDTTYLLLLVWLYLRDNDYPVENINNIKLRDIMNSHVLGLSLLPSLAVVGSYNMNEKINSLTIILVGISLAVLIFRKKIRMETFTIFTLSLSLLYVYWMFSPHIWGRDIYTEYQMAHLTLKNNIWNFYIKQNYNAIPVITLAIPIFSELLKINLTYVFKALAPFYMSLLPVALYHLVNTVSKDQRLSLLVIFLFISDWYYKINYIAVRQGVAELYVVLLLITMIHKRNKILMLSFIIGIILSHYGSASIFLLIMLGAYILSQIVEPIDKKDKESIGKVMLVYGIAMLSWYLYIANSSLYYSWGFSINSIIVGIKEMLLRNTALKIVTASPGGLLGNIYKSWYLATQFIVAVGFLYYIYIKRLRFALLDYFSIMGMGLWGAMVALPFFAKFMDPARTYHFSLLFVSQYFAFGIVALQQGLTKFVHIKFSKEKAYKIATVFLVVFLLFNTGIMYGIFKYRPKEIPTNWEWMRSSTNLTYEYEFYVDFRTFNQNVIASKWLGNFKDSKEILTDTPGKANLKAYALIRNVRVLVIKINTIRNADSYIFLGYNVIHGGMLVYDIPVLYRSRVTYITYNPADALSKSTLYSNGGAIVLN